MLHARDDYSDIQITTNGTTRQIPADEPVFLIRGQDVCGGDAVRAWADLAEQAGAAAGILAVACEHALKMDAWPKKKVADLGRGSVALVRPEPATSVPAGGANHKRSATLDDLRALINNMCAEPERSDFHSVLTTLARPAGTADEYSIPALVAAIKDQVESIQLDSFNRRRGQHDAHFTDLADDLDEVTSDLDGLAQAVQHLGQRRAPDQDRPAGTDVGLAEVDLLIDAILEAQDNVSFSKYNPDAQTTCKENAEFQRDLDAALLALRSAIASRDAAQKLGVEKNADARLAEVEGLIRAVDTAAWNSAIASEMSSNEDEEVTREVAIKTALDAFRSAIASRDAEIARLSTSAAGVRVSVELRALSEAAEAGYGALQAIRDDIFSGQPVSGRNQTRGQEAMEKIDRVLRPDAWDRSKDLRARIAAEDRLAARVKELEEALRPFTHDGAQFSSQVPDHVSCGKGFSAITVGDFRAAARALQPDEADR